MTEQQILTLLLLDPKPIAVRDPSAEGLSGCANGSRCSMHQWFIAPTG